jgi:hypothetical protein
MSNEESKLELPPKPPRLLEVIYGGTIVFLTISAIVVLVALPAWVISLIVVSAAALLLLIGVASEASNERLDWSAKDGRKSANGPNSLP